MSGARQHNVALDVDGVVSPAVHEALERLATALAEADADTDDVAGFGQTRGGLSIGIERLGPHGTFEPVTTGFCINFTVTSGPNEPDTCTVKWV